MTHNRLGNIHFSVMTTIYQMVAVQSVGLYDWGLIHWILHCHHDLLFRMAEKLMSCGQ